jgi:hypothetical protein
MERADDEMVAMVMRAMYGAVHHRFEDVGQPISQMRFLAESKGIELEKMARAAIASLLSIEPTVRM